MSEKVIIVGGDAAGMSAASKIKRNRPEIDLIVFEQGDHISYAACGMPYWLSGVIEDGSKLQVLTPQIAREKRGIDVRTAHKVIAIDRTQKTVKVKDLKADVEMDYPYDRLLLATGARAQIPPIQGMDLPGVFTLRTLADGHRIHDFLKQNSVSHAIIIGSGYIGLEMAEAFRQLGIQTCMLEMLDQIAPTFDPDIMEPIQAHLVEQGVDLRLGTHVSSLRELDGRLSVSTSSGEFLTDLVLVSTGVRPNSELAAEAGLELSDRNAIHVNAFMQTSDPDIFAAGDCVAHTHLVLDQPMWIPLAPSANKGGRIAGENLAGGSASFPGVLGTSVVKVFDYTIAQTGLSAKLASAAYGENEIDSALITASSRAHYYPGATPITVKLVTLKHSGRLLGAQMIGKSDVAKRLDVLATALTAGMTVEQIGLLDLSYAPPVAPVYDPIHVAANVAHKQ